MAQVITSKNTSRVQLPALHGTDIAKSLYGNGAKVLDYGAGLSHEIARGYVLRNGASSYAWLDPYWNSVGGNVETRMNYPYDVVLCANVLNVIDDDEAMYNAFFDALSLLRHDDDGIGTALFTVYEGDRTGKGKATRDGYQRNMKTVDFCAMLQAHIIESYGNETPRISVGRRGRVIIARYKTACEMCAFHSSERTICRMCTDMSGWKCHPYYDVSEYVIPPFNTAGICEIKRLTAFDNPVNNQVYASRLYHGWKHCKDSNEYESLCNAFAQVREGYLGVKD